MMVKVRKLISILLILTFIVQSFTFTGFAENKLETSYALDRSGLVVTASSSDENAKSINAIDGDIDSGLKSGINQTNEQYSEQTALVPVKAIKADKKIIKIVADKQQLELNTGDTHQTVVNAIYDDGTVSIVTSSATYESSDIERVKVTEAGKITGLVPGKAVIKITYKEFTTEIAVKVIPVLCSPELNLEIQGGSTVLTWAKVPEAKTYNVKRGTSPGKLNTIAKNITDTTFRDNGLHNEVTYFYVVTAESDGVESRNSNLAIRAPVPSAPNIYGLRESNIIKINWTNPQDAVKFTLLRSTQSGGPYETLVDKQAINQFEDTTAQPDITYYYIVKPYDKFAREGESSREIVVDPVNVQTNKFDPKDDNDGDGVKNEDELLQSTYSENELQGDKQIDESVTTQQAVSTTAVPENSTKNDSKNAPKKKHKVEKKIKRNFKSESNKVDITVYGEDNLLKAPLEAKEIDNPLLKTLDGAVSDPIEISAGGVDINSAEITISYDKNKLNGIDEKDLKIYWVDWDNKKLVPLEDSKVDTGTMTVTATTTHFSTYILGGTMPVDFSKVDVVFIVDQSEGMSTVDPNRYRFKIIEKFISQMNELNPTNTADADKVRFALLGFSDYAIEKQALTSDSTAFAGKLDEMKNVIGATNIADAIWIGKQELISSTNRRKIIVLLTDGNDTCGNVDDQIIQIVKNFQKGSSTKDIVINTVAIGTDINEQLLKGISEVSGGAYFPFSITSSTTATAADGMATAIYDKLRKQVTFDQVTKPISDDLLNVYAKKARIKNQELYNGTDNRKALMLYTKNNCNLLTGNYIDNVADITVKSSGQDIVFERTYNSDIGDKNTIIGNGWRTNFDTKLETADVKVGTVKVDGLNVRTGAGTNNPIVQTSSGTDLKLAYGSVVTITGDTEIDNNGRVWYEVSFNVGTTEYTNKYIASWYVSKKEIGIKITYGSGTEATFIEDPSRTASGDVAKFYLSPDNIYDTLIKRTNGTYALTKKDQTEYNYFGTGELKYIRDKYNSTLTLNYTNGKLTEIHDPFGRKLTLQYNSDGLLTKVTEPIGRYTEYIYDSNNNLIEVNDLSGKATTYTYIKGTLTGKWLIKQEVDANGHQVIKNEYDKYDRLVKQYGGNNNVRYQIYKDIYKNEDGDIVTQSGSTNITNSDKELASYYIDENGNESKVIFNSVTNNIISSIDAFGNTTTYEYYVYLNDDNNWIDSETGWIDITNIQEGSALESTYENMSKKPRKEVITDKNGSWVSYKYDAMDNLVKVDSLKDKSTGAKVTQRMQYDSKNNLISKTDGNNKTTTYNYENETYLKKVTDPLGNETVYDYYPINEETSIPGIKIGLYGLVKKETQNKKDKDGKLILDFNTTEYKYENGYNNRTEIIDTLDNHTKEKYDSVGRLIEITDARNNTTKYVYDNMDRLVSEEDAFNNKTIIEYDNVGNKRFVTDKNGNTTEYVYDNENQLIFIIDPKGNKVEYKYDASGNKIMEINKKGGVTEYGYDALNRLVSVKDPSNHTTTYSYDANGNLKKVTDANNNETIYDYDALNRKIKEKRQTKSLYDGVTEVVTEYGYDDNNNVVSIKDANANITKYSYDSLNRNTSIIEAYDPDKAMPLVENGSTIGNIETNTVYDVYKDTESGKNFEKITITNAKNKPTIKEYDALGQLVKETDAKNNSIDYTYDAVGNRLTVTDRRDHTTTYYYDELNRVYKISDQNTNEYNELNRVYKIPDQNINYITKKYDAVGNITEEIDKKGNSTKYNYNCLNQLTDVEDALGHITYYTYDEAGNKTTTTDAVGNIHAYQYNSMNQLINETDGKGNTKYYWYDGIGKISAESNWKSIYIRKQYYYDELNRLKETVDQEAGDEHYSYDFVGNLKSYKDKNNNETKYDYDDLNRKVKEYYPADYTIPENIVTNKYDALGNLIRKENTLGTVDLFEYDELGQLLSSTQQKSDGSEAIKTSTTYDENGNKLTVTDGNNVTTTNTYDELDRLKTSQLTVKNQDVRSSIHTTTYCYDHNGNLGTETNEIKSGTNTVSNTYTYHYDELNRLIDKLDPYNKVIQKLEYYDNGTQSKSYDALNNLNQYFYDKNNRLIKTIDPEGHEISQDYDEEGNVSTKTTDGINFTTYDYYETGLLKTVVNAKNETTSYTYDDIGNMLTQKDGKGNVTTYEYNVANKITKRIDNGGVGIDAKTESYSYYGDGTLASKKDRNGITTTYEYDSHGRLIKQVVGSNEIIITHTYDGNGNQLTMTDSTGITTRTYDELNRVTTKKVPDIGTSYFDYDIISDVDEGCVAELSTDPKNNKTTKVYDRAGRIKSVIADGKNTTYTYLDNGSRESIVYSDGSKRGIYVLQGRASMDLDKQES